VKKRYSFGQSKAGVALDIDWIISLGIFLVYLGVFFISIRQLTEQKSETSSMPENLMDRIISSTTWNVQILPLVINSDYTREEPVVIEFAYGWRNFSFTDNTAFEIKDGHLIFASDLLKGTNIFELATSAEAYPRTFGNQVLSASPEFASIDSKELNFYFINSLLSEAKHHGKVRISSFNLSLSGTGLGNGVTYSNITSLSALYKVSYNLLNHTAFVVSNQSRIISYVAPLPYESNNFTISVTLQNYTRFYINESFQGNINHTAASCIHTQGTYVDFSDGVSGLAFLMPSESNVSFCANSSINLQIGLPVKTESRYDLIFHSGDADSTYGNQYPAQFGMVVNMSGISMSKYRNLNETGYDTLKAKWSVQNSKDFSFGLFNESGEQEYDYTPKLPGITNVFAQEKDLVVIDKYGMISKFKLRVRTW
jgi:hypothetical protein